MWGRIAAVVNDKTFIWQYVFKIKAELKAMWGIKDISGLEFVIF